MPRYEELTPGSVFGRWTVLRRAQEGYLYVCRCAGCGDERVRGAGRIISGVAGCRRCGYVGDLDAIGARFWSKVDKSGGHNACWLWMGYRKRSGHGLFGAAAGETFNTARLAWELTHGPIPRGLIVRHYVCDNPPCCNPAHLRTGTDADNSRDAVERRRSGRGKTAISRRESRLSAAPLTATQLSMLSDISRFIAMHGWPPTLRELSTLRGCSMGAVGDLLAYLELKGHIVRARHVSRGIRLAHTESARERETRRTA